MKKNTVNKLGNKAVHYSSFLLAIILGMSMQNNAEVFAMSKEAMNNVETVVNANVSYNFTSSSSSSSSNDIFSGINTDSSFSLWDELEKEMQASGVSQEEIQKEIDSYKQAAADKTDNRDENNYDKHDILARQANFLEMRRALEKLTGTTVAGVKSKGPLYTEAGLSQSTTNKMVEYASTTGDVSAIGFWGTKYSMNKLKEPSMVKNLKELSALTFSDVTGTEWFAQYIPVAVYFNVINGYPDGTFRGNNSVTFAEFCAMRVKAGRTQYYFNENNEDYNSSTGYVKTRSNYLNNYNEAYKQEEENKLSESDWYAYYVSRYSGSVIGGQYNTKGKINSPMTRGEVALNIVASSDSGKVELFNEMIKLKVGSSVSTFNDISYIGESVLPVRYYNMNCKSGYDMYPDSIDSSIEMGYNDVIKSISNYENALNTNSGACPLDVVAALNILNRKGIIMGDENKNSNWKNSVTRAEMLVILQRAAEYTRLSME